MLRLLTGMVALASGLVRSVIAAVKWFVRSWWPGALRGRLRLAEAEFDELRREGRWLRERVGRMEGERAEWRRQAQWRTPAAHDPPAPRAIDFKYWARWKAEAARADAVQYAPMSRLGSAPVA
jgi:hypothetical protein